MSVLNLPRSKRVALVIGMRELADIIEINSARGDKDGLRGLRRAMNCAADNPTIENLIGLGKARMSRERRVAVRVDKAACKAVKS